MPPNFAEKLSSHKTMKFAKVSRYVPLDRLLSLHTLIE